NLPWGAPGNLTNASSFFNGLENTSMIVLGEGNTDNAAVICDNLTSGAYEDWYLPSIDELLLLFRNRFIIDRVLENDNDSATHPLKSEKYWSSTERDATKAYIVEYGKSMISIKENSASVRAIRKF
ncbi:DUF1566 domain-containing protein, partial [Bacteroidota bacterium]